MVALCLLDILPPSGTRRRDGRAYSTSEKRPCPVSNVDGRIMVPVMRYTTRTTPPAIREPQLRVDRSALATRLRRWVVALYLFEHHPALLTHVAKNLHELAKGQIRHLPTPELLHTLEAQILNADEIKPIAELMRGLEEPVPPFPGNASMTTSKAATGRSPVTRPLALPAQIPAQSSDLLLPFMEELRRFDLACIAEPQEGLETKVHPHRVRYFLVWAWIGILFMGRSCLDRKRRYLSVRLTYCCSSM